MSAIQDILKDEQAPVLAQQQPEKPVTVTPPPAVDNSNVSMQTPGSVQSQSQDEQKAALPAIDSSKLQGKAEVQNPAGLAKPSTPNPAPKTYQDMFRELNPYTPPTPEQLEKERKNQKHAAMISAISDGISSLANLYFASQGAPNMFNPDESMSAKNRQMWEKLNKERKEDAARYSQGILNAARLDEERKSGERNYKLALEREKNDNEHWQKQFDAQQKSQAEQQKLAREKFEHDKEQDRAANELAQKRMDEAARQFNVSSSQQAQKIKQESQRITREIQKGQVTFALGNGNGTVNVSTDAINAANVGYVFSKLPAEIRDTVQGDPITDKLTGQVQGHKPPTTEAMLVAIGSYVQQYPEVQDALREIAGQKPVSSGKKPNPMGGTTGGRKPNPMN